MSTTTPSHAKQSTISRPTTPLRPSSRSSLRESNRKVQASLSGHQDAPLIALEPAFAELSDSMADLEANFMHLQIMHESLSRFSENFAAFLYGLNMNAFCVDFPEAPIQESFRRNTRQGGRSGRSTSPERQQNFDDGETTFMTTDTSFVENPRLTPRKPQTPNAHAPQSNGGPSTRGRGTRGGPGRVGIARGIARGGRTSGLARARGRGGRGIGTGGV